MNDKKLKHFILFILITGFSFTLSSFYSCHKENDCFDKDLYEKHKNDACPADCPGVTGCDGAKYCNECEANKQGIRIGK